MDKSDQRLMLRKTIKSIIIVFNHRAAQRFYAELHKENYTFALYISCEVLHKRLQSDISTKLCELNKDILQTQQKKNTLRALRLIKIIG